MAVLPGTRGRMTGGPCPGSKNWRRGVLSADCRNFRLPRPFHGLPPVSYTHLDVYKRQGVSCVIAETFARIFYRNSINIGLPIIECPEAAREIEAGDEVEIDFDSGMIYDRTKGTQYKGQAFPEFMQKIIKAEGLINYINQK